MRLIPTLTLCVLIALAGVVARASNEIAAEPSSIAPGQTVTLKWYFTGDKVVVSGGRFGKGEVVTGRQKLTDKPMKTTHYYFDCYYHTPKAVHVRYEVVVEVGNGSSGLSTYRSSLGWSVGYMKKWEVDNVKTAEYPKDGLVFFQPEADSLERLAVAVVPAKSLSVSDLMAQVMSDMPNRYNNIAVVSNTPITYQGAPAVMVVFKGNEVGHPETPSQSLVLTYIVNDTGYVISARTSAANFKAREALMEKMLHSFTAPGGVAANSGNSSNITHKSN